GLLYDWAGLHHFESVSGHGLELIEVLVVPPRIGCSSNKPVGAVIGDEHTILFESCENDLGRSGETRNVIARFKAQTQSHRRRIGIGVAAGVMSGGVDESR